MCKLWGKPLTDPSIQSLTSHQLLLYQALINRDIRQENKEQREIVEYQVAFTKPDVLMKVLKEREQRQGLSLEENEDVFLEQVSNQFGKPLDGSLNKNPDIEKDIIRPLDLDAQ